MIAPRQKLTAEEFAQRRNELPEGGRWYELHAGEPVLLESPDDAHGTVVLNLSRALGNWLQTSGGGISAGYACHGPGLHVASEPDTVYIPSLLYFDQGPPFGQLDLVIATLVPRLVIDVASSNDRRRGMRDRTLAYLKLGVEAIWVPDPFKLEVQVIRRRGPTMALGMRQSLEGGSVLADFQMPVSEVFAQPEWWTGPQNS